MRRLRARIGLRREDGQSLILFAVALPLVIVVVALVVDGTNVFVQKQSVQNAADAAALAAAQDLTTSACATCGATAGKYLGLNGANYDQPDPSSQAALRPCDPSAVPPITMNCYTNPYKNDFTKVKVTLQKDVPTFFGGFLGLGAVAESASAVASITSGLPPSISFAALNKSCQNHTLLVKLSGQLTVQNAIYVNSCNAPKDAFDIFGAGGNISAPAINVVGGWETHDGSTVTVNGQNCGVSDGSSYYVAPPATSTTPSGCPATGQNLLIDPFKGKIVAPQDGAPAWTSGSTQAYAPNAVTLKTNALGGPAAQAYAYSPNVNLKVTVNASATTINVHQGAISNGDTIQIDSEQMHVTAAPVAGGGKDNWNVTVTRGYNGTTAASHTGGAGTTVFQIVDDTTIQVTNTGGSSSVQNGDTVQVDNEQMLVTGVSGSGPWTLTVTRGYNLTTETTHTATTPVYQAIIAGSASHPAPYEISTGNVTLQPGTYYGGICIGVAAGSDCDNSGATYKCKTVGGSTTTVSAYPSPGESLTTGITDADTTFNVSGGLIAANDVIQVGDEQMLVDTATSGATQLITVERGYNDTETEPTLAAGEAVLHVVTTPNGTAYSPGKTLSVDIDTSSPKTFQVNSSAGISINDVIQIESEAMTVTGIPDGTHLTVTRGTYGTKIVLHHHGVAILLVSPAGSAPPPTVTLAPGTYVMAGGGFGVCGAATLLIQPGAPGGVMIYNTDDSIQGSKVAYNPNVSLNRDAPASSTSAAYSPNPVTLNSRVGTLSNDITYNPNVTLNAATGSSTTTAAYTPNPVKLNLASLGAPTKVVYSPNVILQANATASTTTINVHPASGASSVISNGDVIQIDNEEMRVTAAPVAGGGAGNWNVTVDRAFNGTTASAHTKGAGATVFRVTDTTVQVTNTGGVEVAVNDVIKVDNELMLVAAVSPGAGPWNLTVWRGFNGTAEAIHSVNAAVSKVSLDTLISVTGSAVAVTHVIKVDSEQMTVTGVIPNGANSLLTVTRADNGTIEVAHSSGATVFDVVGDTTVQITNAGSVEVVAGDLIQVGSEQMLVTAVAAGAANIWNLTVVRGYNSTVEASHSAGAAVSKVTPDTTIYVTGAIVDVNDVIQVDSEHMLVSAVTPNGTNSILTVTRAYNGTIEAAHSSGTTVYQPVGTGNGGLGQVDIATSGNVTLTPQTIGRYTGLTIFQDPKRELTTAGCNNRAQNLWDIALVNSGNGLDGISGTIYAGDQSAMFGDGMSGTATLAVVTGCIFINGADSTFNFDTSGGGGLFGVTQALTE